MGLDLPIEKIADFVFYLILFMVGQLSVEVVKSFLFKKNKNDEMVIYRPCPAMEKEHIERFLSAFEQSARSQESILVMLRQIAVTVENEEATINHIMETRKEPFQMIRDIHKKVVKEEK
jgi:hypothetical protein